MRKLSIHKNCDFHIYRTLKITFTNGTTTINLPTKKGYFCDCNWGIDDSDDEDDIHIDKHDYRKLHKQYVEFMLKPRTPIMVYKNGNFINEKFQKKYEKAISVCLQQKNIPMKNTIQIEKLEDRIINIL